MGMNIGPMIRAMMGEAQPADARALELRIGQIVRGVLMELLDNQEAIVNINGVNVKAKLDADMPLGKGTLLQVQPGAGGLVTLKPLPDATEAFADDGLTKDVLKSFGLPEQKWSMDLLRGLKRDGYAIGKDAAAQFQTALSLKPAGVDAESWASAADVAFRRGLKPTETTLSSLRQALFGQPVHEELASLKAAVEHWLGGAKPPTGDTAALGQRLQSLLSQGAALIAEGGQQLTGGQQGSVPAAVAGGAPGEKDLRAAGANAAATVANAEVTGDEAATEKALGAAGRQIADTASAARSAGGRGLAGDAAAKGANAAQTSAARGGAAPLPPQQAPAERAGALNGAAADDGRADAVRPDGAQPSGAKQEAAWIGRFLQWLGVGHERQLLHAAEPRLPGGGLDAGPGAGAAASLAGGGADGTAPASVSEERRAAADTLKGALLALAAHEEAPPALREAAQSLANQVTGQQLLLSSDKANPAPFSHMTLFVPMKGANGETTATVHVQTRRGRKGEWDVGNCHLLFDLRMRNLGDTVVDVQVVDRIVSLKLLSDYPGMGELIENARGELEAGMSSAGFQLLSLSAASLPAWKLGSEASKAQGASGDRTAAVASPYAAKPYKGVDYRA
ncbi:hypothetical protein ACFPPD_25265 [Cohnella suwonensis]|uniref:Flagellar hook-length control protein-like C-terminal domain-containing protein n=1 Tax=Cohnella suwonensis TaxID=696072 RepID=A0ABW0M1I6_9BACL